MANDYNEITNRLHSTREAADESVNHIVSGADEIYDDAAPYRVNGHIECNEVTPVGTENPVELGWYEKIYDTQDPTLFEWELSEDTTVDEEKEYGLPKGAKQSDINNQLYTMVGDITGVTITPSGEVISPDENKIIDKEDGYIPTAGAVGRALGANFEDNLQSTSTVKGLTANMGRVLNENKADINGYYETMSVGSAKNLDGENTNSEAYLIRPTGGAENEVANGVASVLGMEGNSAVWNQLIIPSRKSGSNRSVDTRNNETAQIRFRNRVNYSVIDSFYITSPQRKVFVATIPSGCTSVDLVRNGGVEIFNIIPGLSVTSSHKYYIVVDFKAVDYQTVGGYTWDNVQAIDLTLLGIDNLTTVAQVEAWLAEHVGTKPYYAYNAGTILSAQTLGIKTYGQNLLNPTTKQAKLIPYTWVEDGTTYSNQYTIKNVPSGATATFTPDNTGVAETVDISGGSLDITSYGSGVLELSAATANTYICMKWNTDKDNDVVPYEDHTYDFDVRKVYGKVNGAGEYVQCFPNGMRNTSPAFDYLDSQKAIVRVARIDVSSLNGWLINTPSHSYYAIVPGMIVQTSGYYRNKYILSNKYAKAFYTGLDSGFTDKSLINYNGYIFIKDTSITATREQDIKNAFAGVILDYTLATPITYTDLIYRDGGVDRPLADILMNITVNNWSMEEQLMTDYDEQGNPTSVPATIQTRYSIDAVEAIKTLEESSYFESDIHDNLQAMLTCINTNCASVLGGQFSISETATNKLFNFTFTANVSTNSIEENTETI